MVFFGLLSYFLFSVNRQKAEVFFASLFYFFAYFVSVLYSSDIGTAQSALEVRLPFLVIPLLFAATRISKSDLEDILKAFWLGIGVAGAICGFWAFYMFFKTGKGEYFFYTNLTAFLDFHPTYFSWYVCFAFFSFLFFIEKNWEIFSINQKIATVFYLIILAVFNIFLSARIGLISFFGLFGCWFLIEMYRRKKLLLAVFSIAAFSLVLVFAIWHLNFLRWRLAPYIPGLIPSERLVELPHDSRKDAWKAAFSLAQQNPVLGVGCGDVSVELNKVYALNQATEALEKSLNAHNLYLQTQVAVGFVGNSALFMLIFAPLIHSKNKRTKTTIFWCLLFALFGLTEALLEVQRGTLFAAFFFSFTTLLQEKNEQ